MIRTKSEAISIEDYVVLIDEYDLKDGSFWYVLPEHDIEDYTKELAINRFLKKKSKEK